MNVVKVKCLFVLTAVLLAVAENAASGDNNQPVRNSGLRSDGELVQAKQTAPTHLKPNASDDPESTAYKPKLKNVFVTSYSTGGSADAAPEPTRANTLNAKQPEE